MTLTAPINERLRAGRLPGGVDLASAVEWVYGAFLVFALTQGPVLSVWLRTGQLGQVPPERAIDPSYLLVHLPALIYFGRRFRRGLVARWPAVLVSTLVLYLGATTVWSLLRADTAISVIAMMCTTLAGVYLALTYTIDRLVLVVFVGMQPGLLLSELAVRHKWQDYRDYGHNWAGIYYNRNSLGPVAAMGLATGALVALTVLHRRRGRWPLVLGGIALVLAYDLRFLVRSGSATSFAFLALILAVFTAATLARNRLGHRVSPRRAQRLGMLYISGLFAAAALVWGLRDQISSLLHRPPGFDGRTIYWEASLRGFRVHPLRGWGWLAAWRAPSFKVLVPDELKGEVWSHSAYLDMALGGGIIAVVLLVIVFVKGFGNAMEVAFSDTWLAAWPLALCTAVAVASTQESFLIGNHFLWLLFVAAIVTLAAPRAHDPSPSLDASTSAGAPQEEPR